MRTRLVMSSAAPPVTAEELERQPQDDYRYELVEGRIIRMSPVGCQHGGVVAQLLFLLKQYQQRKPVGRVFTEVGFKLATKPDTVRAPDVAFVRLERFPSPEPQGFFQGPPDLAVEVISPDDRPSDVRSKVEEYLSRGVPLVVVVDPSDRSVTSFRRLTPPSQLRQPDDRLDLGDVVPGFSCRLQEIFEA